MIKLSEHQKEQILEIFSKDSNILNITRKIFDDDKLDGRSKEGKVVAKFLATN